MTVTRAKIEIFEEFLSNVSILLSLSFIFPGHRPAKNFKTILEFRFLKHGHVTSLHDHVLKTEI